MLMSFIGIGELVTFNLEFIRGHLSRLRPKISGHKKFGILPLNNLSFYFLNLKTTGFDPVGSLIYFALRLDYSMLAINKFSIFVKQILN